MSVKTLRDGTGCFAASTWFLLESIDHGRLWPRGGPYESKPVLLWPDVDSLLVTIVWRTGVGDYVGNVYDLEHLSDPGRLIENLVDVGEPLCPEFFRLDTRSGVWWVLGTDLDRVAALDRAGFDESQAVFESVVGNIESVSDSLAVAGIWPTDGIVHVAINDRRKCRPDRGGNGSWEPGGPVWEFDLSKNAPLDGLIGVLTEIEQVGNQTGTVED